MIGMFYRIVMIARLLQDAVLPGNAQAISLEEATYTAIENSPTVRTNLLQETAS